MLHLVGCLYCLYQWCTVNQISDNEIYLLIKYIKSVLWREVKCLSYIEEARCLKFNQHPTSHVIISYFIVNDSKTKFYPAWICRPTFVQLFITTRIFGLLIRSPVGLPRPMLRFSPRLSVNKVVAEEVSLRAFTYSPI